MTERLQSDLELPPFIPIFLGLDEHLRLGKMSLPDLGVYLLLHRWCQWQSGIYYGCAATIAALMGGRAKKAEVQRSLNNLRRYQFINYRFGRGSRGSYNILIHKYLPRVGELRGYRLNAFAPNGLDEPLYDRANGRGTLDGLSYDGGDTVEQLNPHGEQTVREPLQEGQEFKTIRILEFKRPKEAGRSVVREPHPSAAVPYRSHLSFSQDRTGINPVVTEGECPSRVEPQSQREAASDPVTEPVLRAESDAPAQLASRFFEFQGSPAKFQAALPAWTERFGMLLQACGDDLPAMLEYAFRRDTFWSQRLVRADDPLGYFEHKIETISERFRQWQTAMNNRKKKVQPKEASNGQQRYRSGTDVVGKQQVDNRAAAEEAKRRIAERVGIEG